MNDKAHEMDDAAAEPDVLRISGGFYDYEAARLTATLSYARHRAAPMAELIVSAYDLTQRGYYLAQRPSWSGLINSLPRNARCYSTLLATN